MTKSSIQLCLCLTALLYGTANGQTHPQLDTLYKTLASGYNKNIRPTYNLDQPTYVGVSFSLLLLKEFIEKDGKLAIIGLFYLYWHDQKMVWDPKKYGGITTFLIPQNDVWKPEIVMVNPYSNILPLGYDRLNIRATNIGTMVWLPGDVYETTCAADITYYPFDEHTCQLIFTPWMYLSPTELCMHNVTDSIDTSNYYRNGIWELTDTKLQINTYPEYQHVVLTIQFRRRPLFQIMSVIVPISVLGLLNVLVFLLPAESGERVGFSITVLLAMVVFLTIVSDSLPNTSVPNIPRMSYLLTADLVISTLVTVCTILGLRFHHKPEDQAVPIWLQYVTCRMSCRTSRPREDNLYLNQSSSDGYNDVFCSHAKRTPIYHSQHPLVYKGRVTEVDNHGYHGYRQTDLPPVGREETVKEVHDHNVSNTSPRMSDEAEKVTWTNIAVFFDKLLFVFFLCLIIAKNIMTIVIFIGLM